MIKKLEDCTVMVVDDTVAYLDILVDTIGNDYSLLVATSGEAALELVKKEPPDLMLLDIMMPGMDGFEVCRKVKIQKLTEDIPIIFLTSMTEITDKAMGFELGAVDYITKPFDVLEVKARVKTHLSLVLSKRQVQHHNEILEIKVAERTRELTRAQDATILSLASLAETRDNETGGHILRTQSYVKALANKLATLPKFAPVLDTRTIELFYKCAPLHDIGKVGVPDAILLKPGKLTDEEFDIMRTHCELGYQALLTAERLLESDNRVSYLAHAMDIAYTHHEKYNGTGYPRKLAGDDIPLSGRIMALADVYDALVSKRVYKQPITHEKSVAIIKDEKGAHFDPDVVDAFLEITEEFHRIALDLAD